MTWTIIYTPQAKKDAKRIESSGLKTQTQELLKILETDPYKNPPRFEKLSGNLTGAYSRRINIQHRLVSQIYSDKKIIKVLRMWSHYE